MDIEKETEARTQKSLTEHKTAGECDGWENVGYFGSYLLYARNNLRRIVEPGSGKIVMQYIKNDITLNTGSPLN